VAVARSGNAEVGLSARHPHQIAAGSRLGAAEIKDQYDLVVECAGTESAVNQAMELCRPHGTLLMLGTYWQGLSFPMMAAMMKEVTIVPSYMYAASGTGRDFDIAAALLANNPEIANTLITHRFPLAEVSQAYSVARDRKAGAIKVVLEP
jgi:threonine dehydrogenase-like Zn-dependent dehydrogenase